MADLDRLRDFGRSGSGVVRRAFSEQDIAARRWLARRMEEAGLTPRWDPAGNLFGLPPGDGPFVLVGSHSDTQLTGGWLDGAFGVIAGLEIARAAGGGVACVSFQDEEGRFGNFTGSGTWLGDWAIAEADGWRDWDGIRLGDLRGEVPEVAGGTFPPVARFSHFIELHIEQGPVLDTAGEAVGVVEAIVGARDLGVRFTGQQNHAGTTPMRLRRDAVRGLTLFAHRLEAAFAPLMGEATVWTLGRITVEPNARSIVPGAAEVNVQWRDASADRLAEMDHTVRATAEAVAADLDLGLGFDPVGQTQPMPMDPGLVALLEEAAEATAPGRWRRMPSGALHDANIVAGFLPTAMVFAPSIGGISHSFEEDTGPEDLILAAQTAARAVGRLLGQFPSGTRR